jgi:hypothetical protein
MPTANYGFVTPTLGGDDALWGVYLNQNWTDLDADLTTIQAGLDARVIGTHIQAWYANLDQIAALAPTADNFIAGNAGGTAWEIKTPAAAITSLGITATAAELNTLAGATLSVAELNFVDGVTSAIQTQLDLLAPVDAPTFTGVPAAPTASVGADTTQIATTEFVQQEQQVKAWVVHNQSSITDDLNVSSVTDNGTGDYTINFTTAMGNTGYSVAAVSNNSGYGIMYTSTIAVGSIRCRWGSRGSADIDVSRACVTIFSDQ